MLDLKFYDPIKAHFHIVSPDGGLLFVQNGTKCEIRRLPSLEIVEKLDEVYENVSFSPNSSISFTTKSSYRITDFDSLDITAKVAEPIKRIIWNHKGDIVAFISDLELFIVVQDIKNNKKYKLKGATFDLNDDPLCHFSPNDDFFCTYSGQKVFIYCCQRWTLNLTLTFYGALNFKFISPYFIILANENSFSVYSVYGSKIYEETSLPDECVKDISVSCFCTCLALYSNSLLLYESVSLKRLLRIDYAQKIGPDVLIWEKFDERMRLKFVTFQVESIKNINDEFKVKRKDFFTSFSWDGRLIASYNPGMPRVVWIHRWDEEPMLKSVVLIDQKVFALKWAKENVLAVVCSDQVVFWTESSCSCVLCDNVEFNWIRRSRSTCTIGNKSIVQLLSIGESLQ